MQGPLQSSPTSLTYSLPWGSTGPTNRVDGEENKTTCDELVNTKTLSKSMEKEPPVDKSVDYIRIISPYYSCDAKDVEAMKM